MEEEIVWEVAAGSPLHVRSGEAQPSGAGAVAAERTARRSATRSVRTESARSPISSLSTQVKYAAISLVAAPFSIN